MSPIKQVLIDHKPKEERSLHFASRNPIGIKLYAHRALRTYLPLGENIRERLATENQRRHAITDEEDVWSWRLSAHIRSTAWWIASADSAPDLPAHCNCFIRPTATQRARVSLAAIVFIQDMLSPGDAGHDSE